jgi:hypothetical protein
MREGFDHWVGVDGFDVVDTVLGKDQVTPRHEKAPLDALSEAVLYFGNGPILSHLNHLLALHNLVQLAVHARQAIVVITTGIAIVAQQVHPDVTRIPIGFGGAPHPNQVIDAVEVGDSFEDDAIEGKSRCASLCAPPKPFPSSLVQWPPKNRDLAGLQSLQLNCNRIDVPHSCIVLGCVCHNCL